MVNGLCARKRHHAGAMVGPSETRSKSPAARCTEQLWYVVFQLGFLDDHQIRVLRQVRQIALPAEVAPFGNIPVKNLDVMRIQ